RCVAYVRRTDDAGVVYVCVVNRSRLQALVLAVVEVEVAHQHGRGGHQRRDGVATIERDGSRVGSCGPVHPLRGASRNSVRATMLIASTMSAMSAAPPQARRCQSS